MKRAFGGIAAFVLVVFALIYLPFFHYTEPTQVGIVRNLVTGDLKLDTPGWNVTAPWVSAAKIDTRPMRVCITSAGRGFNCRLVEFQPEAYREFVATEGFYYYWWANRISFNFGYDDEYRGVKDLLRGYAYSVKQYPFVRTVRQYNEGE